MPVRAAAVRIDAPASSSAVNAPSCELVQTEQTLGTTAPLDVGGGAAECLGVVVEGAKGGVVAVADEAADARPAAALRGVAVDGGEDVVVVDGIRRSERFAADRAASTLRRVHPGDIGPTHALSGAMRRPWVAGTDGSLGSLAGALVTHGCGAAISVRSLVLKKRTHCTGP